MISPEKMDELNRRLEALRPIELTRKQGQQHREMTDSLLRQFKAERTAREARRD